VKIIFLRFCTLLTQAQHHVKYTTLQSLKSSWNFVDFHLRYCILEGNSKTKSTGKSWDALWQCRSSLVFQILGYWITFDSVLVTWHSPLDTFLNHWVIGALGDSVVGSLSYQPSAISFQSFLKSLSHNLTQLTQLTLLTDRVIVSLSHWVISHQVNYAMPAALRRDRCIWVVACYSGSQWW